MQLLGRLRSDRVLRCPPPPAARCPAGRPGMAASSGWPTRHWPAAAETTSTATARYGTARASAWQRLHPRLERRDGLAASPRRLPVIEGTLIRLQVDHLPGDRDPKPVWLWSSAAGAAPAEVDRCWQAFLRRFDLEHTFRLFKQVLGWTAPKIRDPAAADRWTWLIIAATPSSASPARWPPTCAGPGSAPPRPGGSPPPGCAGDFAASARRPPVRPARQNPAAPARAPTRLQEPPPRTPATTSARTATRQRTPSSPVEIKG